MSKSIFKVEFLLFSCSYDIIRKCKIHYLTFISYKRNCLMLHNLTGLCCLEGSKMSFERPRFSSRYCWNFACWCLPLEFLLKSRWTMWQYWPSLFYFHKTVTSYFLGLISDFALWTSFYLHHGRRFLCLPHPLVMPAVTVVSEHGWPLADWAGNSEVAWSRNFVSVIKVCNGKPSNGCQSKKNRNFEMQRIQVMAKYI